MRFHPALGDQVNPNGFLLYIVIKLSGEEQIYFEMWLIPALQPQNEDLVGCYKADSLLFASLPRQGAQWSRGYPLLPSPLSVTEYLLFFPVPRIPDLWRVVGPTGVDGVRKVLLLWKVIFLRHA